MSDYRPAPRELQALVLIARGLRTAEAAGVMGISWKTVDTYIARAKKAMGARTVRQLMFMLGSEVRGEKGAG